MNKPSSPEEAAELIVQLKDPRSAKRRSAAIALRKYAVTEAGPALLQALQVEVPKAVTWETQYQMIRALGDLGYEPALPYLRELAGRETDATMLYTALGDAIFRLARKTEPESDTLLAMIMSKTHDDVKWGAMRAVALLRIKLSPETAAKVLHNLPPIDQINEPALFFPATACDGWTGSAVDAFLTRCETSRSESVREAARKARPGRYSKFNPL